jgi:hypothetical protein
MYGDVIFDHDTLEMQYLVVDSDGWLEAGTFLLRVDRVSADENDEDSLVAGVTRQQIVKSPQYDNSTLQSKDEWKKYEQEFKRYWDEAQVFSDTAPGSSKVTLRPKSAARAEEAASGGSLLKPRRWESSEDYLRLNKKNLQAKCPECASKAA